jgi:hypothetical protein
MSHSLRRAKASHVTQTLREASTFRGDQGAVWDGIDQISSEAGVHSRTRSMREVYEEKKEDLEGYLNAFPYVPSQKGIFVMINGEVVGFDVLSLSSVYETLHPKLVKSYAMDASLQQGKKVGKGSAEKAKAFIGEVGLSKEERFKSVGHGWDHRFDGPRMVGSALVHEGKTIHMAFFRIGESEKAGGMSPASRRRRFRA